MTGGRERVRGLLAGLLLAVALAIGIAPGLPLAVAQSSAPSPTGSPRPNPSAKADPWIRLDSLPPRLSPETPDAMTITVVAGSQEIPAGWSVMLTMQPRVLASRTAVRDWRTGTLEGPVGQEVVTVPLTTTIPAGGEQQVELQISPDAKARLLDPAVFGAHGAAVLLLDDNNDTRRALTRTFLIAGTPPTPTTVPRVTVLVPITPSALAVDWGTAAAATLPEIQPGGRLDRLRELATRPGVVAVVDPAALTLEPDPVEGVVTPGEAGLVDPELQEWRTRLAASLAGHEVIGLPYADPDVVALQEAQAAGLAQITQRIGHDTLTAAGLTTREDVAVPIDGDVNAAAAGLYTEMGRTAAIVLDANEQPMVRPSRATPTGRGDLKLDGGVGDIVPTVLTDPALSAALAATADDGPSGGVAASQRLLADLVVLSGEAPTRERHFAVITTRGFNPNASSQTAIEHLVAGGYTQPDSFARLLESPSVDREQPRLSVAQRQAVLPTTGVDSVATTLTDGLALASTFTQSEDGADRAQRMAAGLVSGRWRADPNRWAPARMRFTDWVSTLRTSVHVVPGSTVTQVSRNVRLPVTVENITDGDVVVEVTATPRSNRLVVTKVVTVTVPARSRAIGYIPVRGVSNGDTSVEIRLHAPSGVELGTPVVTKVRVRADWETVGTRTIAGLVSLVLVVGLVRSFRRGPRARQARDPLRADQPSRPGADR